MVRILVGFQCNSVTRISKSQPFIQSPVHPNAFVEVEIPDDLSAGRYTLEITQGNKYSILDYPILEREKGSLRNQGFSVDDVIYLITPDRFANGNTTNDQVEGILDDFDF